MENMRKIVFHCQMTEVGTDSWEFYLIPADWTNDDINDFGQELANNNAETYGYYSWPSDDLEEGEEDECYDDNIGASWFDYVPEKHDMYRVGSDDSWREA